MPFTAACVQMAPRKGDVAGNLDRIAELALQASGEGADLAIFPETATTGYFLEGGVHEHALPARKLAEELDRRLQGSLQRPLDLLAGFYESSAGNLYNSAAYLELGPNGRGLVHVYRKFFLPTYGLFEEEKFVSRGTSLGVFETRLGKMGVLVCEDVWHSILPTLCAVAGAQAILVPSASPARGFAGEAPENHDRYKRMLRAIGEEHGVYALNAQLCGFEAGKGFVGGSFVVDPFGRTAAESPILEEHLLLAPVDFDLIGIARAATPLLSDLQGAWPTIQRLADEAATACRD
jgi:N-carbamoylputrescine amidase